MNRRTAFSLTVILSIAVGFSTSLAVEATLVDKAKEEGKLIAYLAMNAADAVTVQATFEKKFPQIKVDLVRAGPPAILQRVLTEYRGGRIFADVVLGFGFIHYEVGQQKLLGATIYRSGRITCHHSRTKMDFGSMLSPSSTPSLQSTTAARQTTVRYAELLLPKWKGKAGMLPVRSDIAAKYSIHPDKIRMIPPKEEAKTGYYAKLFDDLFVKQTK